jgi:hypothetical protein
MVLMLVAASAARAQAPGKALGNPTVNAQGIAGACVAVTTASAVAVVAGDATRLRWSIYNNSSCQAHCEYGSIANAAPATTPSASAGMPIPGFSTASESVNPQNRLDCIADSCTASLCVTENR